MALVRPVFLDTSVLLGGLVDFGDASASAQAIFDALVARRLGRARTAWHCCLEFYAVITRVPEEFRLTPRQAVELIEAEIFGRLEILEMPAASRLRFLRSAAGDGISGGRLYDAHIAQIARSSGSAVIVTDNVRHFAALAGEVLVLTCSEAVRALRAG